MTKPIKSVTELNEVKHMDYGFSYKPGRAEENDDGVMYIAEDHLVCPWCGHVHSDMWEILPHRVEVECDTFCHNCSRDFTVSYEATYSVTAVRKSDV